MKAGLAGLQGVTSVEHEAGTNTFVVRHVGQLGGVVEAAESVVLLKWARRWLERMGQRMGVRDGS